MTKPVYREVKREITSRDFAVLNFLWRWKVVSPQALAKKFFPGIRPESANVRLRHLAEAGYLESLQVGRRQFVAPNKRF